MTDIVGLFDAYDMAGQARELWRRWQQVVGK
jgi:hypothetical protein